MKNGNNALEETWEWKERVYQEVKELSDAKYCEKLRLGAVRLLSEHNISLVHVHRNHLKQAA
jgi:hypothetical protein